MVSADVAGENASFVAVAQEDNTDYFGILGMRKGDEGEEVFFFHKTFEETTVVPLSDAPEGSRPVSLGFSSTDHRFVALLASEEGFFLAGFPHSETGEAALAPLIDGAVPEDLVPRAATTVLGSTLVAGDGIAVFRENQWDIQIDPGTGPPFNAIDGRAEEGGAPLLVAVGNSGRLAIGDGAVWTEQESGAPEDLLDVQVDRYSASDGVIFAAVGQNGRLLTGTREGIRSCVVHDAELTVVATTDYWSFRPNPISLIAITADGDQLCLPWWNSGIPMCATDRPPGAVLDVELLPCGFSINARYLLEDGYLGGAECISSIP